MEEELINKNNYNGNFRIPILDGYSLVDNPVKALFVAKAEDNSTEQYIEEGKLRDNESYSERLQNIIQTQESLQESHNFQKSPFLFIKDYETDILKFKIYLQDNVREGQCIRQLNAYFLDPKSNFIYQIVLSAPPLNIKDINDNVLKNIYRRLSTILNNIKYNNQEIKESY